MLPVETLTCISDIPAAQWDALAGDNVVEGHGWFRTLEETSLAPVERRYFLVGPAGQTIGAAAAEILPPGLPLDNLDDLLFGRLRRPVGRLGVSWLPALICGPFWGYGRHCLVRQDATSTEQRQVIESLLDALEREAVRQHCGIAFVGVRDEEVTLAAELEQRGYLRVAHEPLNYLDIEWSSFREYRSKLMTRNARKSVRREINRNRSAGVRLENVDDPSIHQGRLYELVRRHFQRQGRHAFPFTRDWFCRLKANLGSEVSIDLAWTGEIITGVSVQLHRGGLGHGILTAVDHGAAGDPYTYFMLAYYRSIERAIAVGVRRLYTGTGQYLTKSRRGFRTLDMSAYIKPDGTRRRVILEFWSPILGWWLRRKIARDLGSGR